MSRNSAELFGEKKNKRKGAFYSVTLHALLLLIAILPFLDPPADIDKNFAIVVEFEKPIVVKKSGSSSKESAASSSSEQANKPSEDNAKPARNTEKVERIERVETNKPANNPVKEVLTAPKIEEVNFPESVETPEVIETTTPSKTPTPTSSSTSEPSIDDFLPVLDQIIEEDESGGSGSGSGEAGDSDFDPNASGTGGDGGSGAGQKDNGGKASGSGTGSQDLPPGFLGSGDGQGGVGYDGEGPLTRKIKKRANCNSSALEVSTNATIVLDLCINRAGQITYSKYNLRQSSIKDRTYAREITNCFRNTIFYQDNSAPYKECGTYTYKIEVN